MCLSFRQLPCAYASDSSGATQFHKNIEPILSQYCFDCHADGANKGGVAFDTFKSDQNLLENHDLWWNALKYLRAGIMPPAKKAQPTAEEKKQIAAWIKTQVFGINLSDSDPGRVTLRRLNRVEYRNTIRDLMGVDFNTDVEFPPDDTGYGFDDIGDVLTLSPMLFEKYMEAAKTIVTSAVPTVSRVMPETIIAGNHFRAPESNSDASSRGKDTSLSLSYAKPAAVFTTFEATHEGSYQLALGLAIKGGFDYDAGKCRVTVTLDDRELLDQEFAWQDNKTFPPFQFNEKLPAGTHKLGFKLEPVTNNAGESTLIEMRLLSVTVDGPMEKQYWASPKNYERFFPKEPPSGLAARQQYAREILRNFASKAFRRPVDNETVERFAKFAQGVYTQPGKSFEDGISSALVGVISSPRFLFRIEQSEPHESEAHWSLVDEYALASRLSYFIWSTMPDPELMGLAARHELRTNLSAQVKRLINDPRSESLVQNFTGQWLQARDLPGISSDARAVLARDDGTEAQLKKQIEAFRLSLAGAAATPKPATNVTAGTNSTLASADVKRNNRIRFNRPRVQLTPELRQAMRSETEMFFSSVMHEDRSVTNFIDSDYTFLNQNLAKFYGLTNLEVSGSEMRRVTLPPDCPRGGVLTEGTVLVVTSNPDRTSPVKRGLFVLSNILGTPAPPPPPNIPALEASEKDFTNQPPTLRAALELHRNQPLCASCHQRMDPIGLGMENFNAMGMWRTKERAQPIDVSGTLITGESFDSVSQLKHILITEHRTDFYRCLTEKLLTYAVGRGLEYYDVGTVDKIVDRLGREDGHFSALLAGIIESAPFQERRNFATPAFIAGSDQSTKVAAIQTDKTKTTQ